jgi:hypothetical protein
MKHLNGKQVFARACLKRCQMASLDTFEKEAVAEPVDVTASERFGTPDAYGRAYFLPILTTWLAMFNGRETTEGTAVCKQFLDTKEDPLQHIVAMWSRDTFDITRMYPTLGRSFGRAYATQAFADGTAEGPILLARRVYLKFWNDLFRALTLHIEGKTEADDKKRYTYFLASLYGDESGHWAHKIGVAATLALFFECANYYTRNLDVSNNIKNPGRDNTFIARGPDFFRAAYSELEPERQERWKHIARNVCEGVREVQKEHAFAAAEKARRDEHDAKASAYFVDVYLSGDKDFAAAEKARREEAEYLASRLAADAAAQCEEGVRSKVIGCINDDLDLRVERIAKYNTLMLRAKAIEEDIQRDAFAARVQRYAARIADRD